MNDPDVIEAEAASAATQRAKVLLGAKLFSADGKLAITLLELSPVEAVATTDAPPQEGSIAVMSRNGVRVCALVARVDERRLRLTFDDPLDERALDQLLGGARSRSGARA